MSVACGIQFCVECHTEGGHDECTRCLPHTLLFEGEECLAGIFAEILEVAEEQEREVEEEERLILQTRLDREDNDISPTNQLFLLLPFFLTAQFFPPYFLLSQ